MLWRRKNQDTRELETHIKELRQQVKQLESEKRQLSGQVTIFKAARDFMNLLFYRIPASVIIADDKGRIMKVSQKLQDMIGYTEPELVGKYTVELSTRVFDLITIQEHIFERMAAKEDVNDLQGFLRHRDGRELPVYTDIAFVRDDSGKNLGAVGVIRARD
jgi:PAS domain S-box-containing protein